MNNFDPKSIAELVARLDNWTHEFGQALCPKVGYSDTYGEGVRAMKEEVANIIRGLINPRDQIENQTPACRHLSYNYILLDNKMSQCGNCGAKWPEGSIYGQHDE